jgi:hypothetical protein
MRAETATWPGAERTRRRGLTPHRGKRFPLFQNTQPVTKPQPAPYSIGIWGNLPVGVKRLGRKSHISPQSIVEIKNIRMHSSTPPIRLHATVLHYAQDRPANQKTWQLTVDDTSLSRASKATQLNSLLALLSTVTFNDDHTFSGII